MHTEAGQVPGWGPSAKRVGKELGEELARRKWEVEVDADMVEEKLEGEEEEDEEEEDS